MMTVDAVDHAAGSGPDVGAGSAHQVETHLYTAFPIVVGIELIR